MSRTTALLPLILDRPLPLSIVPHRRQLCHLCPEDGSTRHHQVSTVIPIIEPSVPSAAIGNRQTHFASTNGTPTCSCQAFLSSAPFLAVGCPTFALASCPAFVVTLGIKARIVFTVLTIKFTAALTFCSKAGSLM